MDNCGHFWNQSMLVNKSKSKFFQKTGRMIKKKEDTGNQTGMKEGTCYRSCSY